MCVEGGLSDPDMDVYMRSYLISICGYTVILCSIFKIYKALSFIFIHSLVYFYSKLFWRCIHVDI